VVALANNYFLNNYKGVGDVDPVTGTFNQFQAEDLVDYMDPEKIIKDVYSTFKPEKRLQGVSYVGKDGFIHYDEMEFDGISKDRLQPSFNSALKSNPQYMAYLGQKSRIAGVPPEGAEAFVTSLANQRAQDLSYMNISSKGKMEANPYSLARYKAGLDKENIDYMMSSMRYEPVAPNVTASKAIDIDPDSWRNDVFNSFPNILATGLLAAADLFNPKPFSYAETYVASRSLAKPGETLDTLLSKTDPKVDNRLMQRNVNPSFARQVWEQTKKEAGPEFTSKYSRDSKYTKEIESKFWKELQTAQNDIAAFKSTTFDIPTQAKSGILESIIPELLSGRASVYKPGDPTQRQSGEAASNVDQEILDAIYDSEKGKIRHDAVGLKYAQVGPGYTATGYQIDTPKGSIVVVDQNTQRRE